MKLKVAHIKGICEVAFAFPVRPNRNHKNTAFGGSLVAGQALACWASLVLLLEKLKIEAEVVVQRQNSEFLRPVTDNFLIKTLPIAAENKKIFIKTLKQRGKARINVKAKVICRGDIAGEYSGDYVAILLRKSKRTLRARKKE